MANLIITIISIALVAIAAIMGAYYGGTAFVEGQAKARAAKIVNDLSQLDAAIKLYGVNNSGTKVIPNAPFFSPVAGNWNVFVSDYMSGPPMPDELSGAMANYMCAKLANASGGGYDEMLPCSDTSGVYDGSFLIAPVSEGTCRAVVRMMHDGVFTSFYQINGGNLFTLLGMGAPGERKFDCGALDDSSGGVIDGGSYYWVVYRWE